MRVRYLNLAVVVGLLGSLLVWTGPVYAQISSCNISASPNAVTPSSDTEFSFGIYNSDPNDIQWIQITPPAGNLVTLESANAYNWQDNVVPGAATFTAGDLPQGSSQGFNVEALAEASDGGPANWNVQISDQPDGSNAFTCDPSYLGLSVAAQPSTINISNVAVTDIAPTSVDVTWDTDVASTSQVAYGSDTNYGTESGYDSSLDTSHIVHLSGLEPNSAYHFTVTSTTPDGGTSTSGDNTFLTALYQPPVIVSYQNPGTVTDNVPGVNTTPGAYPHVSTPPIVSILTSLQQPFKKPPTISGMASDAAAVARVEYSTDGGVDWLPVNLVTGGPKKVAFAFTPILQEDGNYKVLARAIDTSGNIGLSAPQTLVLDTMPPQVGAMLMHIGPNIITPDANRVTNVLAGTNESITLSALGGPTSVVLVTKALYGQSKVQTFSLGQSQDTGLWSGVISFDTAGAYSVTAEEVDGAANRVTQPLFEALVGSAPKVTSSATGKVIKDATVSVYVSDPETGGWDEWDAGAYHEQNPQRVGGSGTYHLMLPVGEYYLSVQAPGYHPVVSQIFHVSATMPIETSFSLSGSSIFDFIPDRATVVLSAHKLIAPPSGLAVGDTPRPFILTTLSGSTIQSINLNGKPTVLTALAMWHPSTSEQLPALESLQQNPNINVLPVAVQENAGEVGVYLQRDGSSPVIAPDPTGSFTSSFGPSDIPTHYFLDRHGVLRKVVVGVLSKSQLLNDLEQYSE